MRLLNRPGVCALGNNSITTNTNVRRAYTYKSVIVSFVTINVLDGKETKATAEKGRERMICVYL